MKAGFIIEPPCAQSRRWRRSAHQQRTPGVPAIQGVLTACNGRNASSPSNVLPFQYGVPKPASVIPACADTRPMCIRWDRRAYRPECHSSRKRHPLRSRSAQHPRRDRKAVLELPSSTPPSTHRREFPNGLSALNFYCASCCGCISVWRFAMRPGRPCSGTRIHCFWNTRPLPTLPLMARFAGSYPGWGF